MTDEARINDVIARLEKIAETFEDRCNKINEHLEDHSRRIVTLEVIRTQGEKRPAIWQNYSAVVSALVAVSAFVIALMK